MKVYDVIFGYVRVIDKFTLALTDTFIICRIKVMNTTLII